MRTRTLNHWLLIVVFATAGCEEAGPVPGVSLDVAGEDVKTTDGSDVSLDVNSDGDTVDADAKGTGDTDAEAIAGLDSVSGDITDATDVSPGTCTGEPKVDCPCDKKADKDCCLAEAHGLSCFQPVKPANAQAIWIDLWDCGCSHAPECLDYPIMGLCGQ